MAKYLTVQQLKWYNDGLDISTYSDFQLAQDVQRAETAIDGFMGFDQQLEGGFEPGFRVTQFPYNRETRQIDFSNSYLPMRRVISYGIQVSNRSTDGGPFYAQVNPNEVVINNSDKYLEIVPLESLIYSDFAGIMNLGLDPLLVHLECEQGFYFTSKSETLLDADGQGQTYVASRGFWADTFTMPANSILSSPYPVPYVVKKNGTPITSGFTAHEQDGYLFFTSGLLSTDVVTLDYVYQIPDAVRLATLAQAFHILEEKIMKKMGMFRGIQSIKNGDQQFNRPGRPVANPNGDLCEEAATILSKSFERLGIA